MSVRVPPPRRQLRRIAGPIRRLALRARAGLAAVVLAAAVPVAIVSVHTPVAAQDAPAPARLDLTDGRQVRAVYFDLLGRAPTLDEAALAATGRPEMLVRLLSGSREFWEAWYEDELFYFLLLGNARPEDAAADESLSARLSAGTLDMPSAVREIVGGQAFHRANPGNDTFVSVVLEQLLGVVVQRNVPLLEAGKKMYDGHAAYLFGEQGNSQSDVVAIVSRQPDFLRRLVERQYRRIVGADPPRASVDGWADRLRARPDCFPELAGEWVLSPAYAERRAVPRAKTDLQFLRGLFVDLTGKPPDRERLQRMRAALGVLSDAGPLRSVIARVLLQQQADVFPPRGGIDTGHPALEDWVDGLFRRFLGRSATPEELQSFALTYRQEEACQPATLAAAIVTHPDYQFY